MALFLSTPSACSTDLGRWTSLSELSGTRPRTSPADPSAPWVACAQRARLGDRSAFAELYRLLAPRVRAFLLAHVRPAEAGDLLQEVFARALERIGELQQPESVLPWLFTLARNRAHDQARRARASERLEAEHEAQQADPQSSAEASEILQCVRQLPSAYRETLVLRLVEGLSGEEIAEAVGMTHGSVRVNLCRGMKLLRERLREEGWE